LAHTHKKGKFTWSCNLLSLQILELTKYEKCDASRGEVTNECYSLYIWPLDFYIIIIIVRRNFYLFGLRCTTLSRWYVVVMFNVRTILLYFFFFVKKKRHLEFFYFWCDDDDTRLFAFRLLL
jgi:hypothetical protein